MEVKETNYKRFIAGEGKALRWVEINELYNNFVRYSPYEEVIDVNNIVGDVEEITHEEYEEWLRTTPSLGAFSCCMS